jgi:hypothetical protein
MSLHGITPTGAVPLGKVAKRLSALLLIAAALALCAVAVGLSPKWPFAQDQILQDLREASDSQVQVRTFHETYFPSPSCILEGLVFQHEPSAAKPLITIQKLTIQGSYLGMLRQRVSRITAEGLVVVVPPLGTGKAFQTTHSKRTVAEIVADGSVIEFLSRDSRSPVLRFDLQEARFQNVAWKEALKYRVKVHNPEPPGEVRAAGSFGPWNLNETGQTPVSGKYEFQDADLSIFEGIAGKLSSRGKFDGTLNHMDVAGTTDTPDFQVKSSRRTVGLKTQFKAYVDATRGDTYLKQVEANFRNTQIEADGSIAGSPGGNGKTAIINLRSTKARIQDLLLLFVDAGRAPMSGDVLLEAKVEIPSGQQQFLRKVKLSGRFGIGEGRFADPSTQKGVDQLSAGALGKSASEKDQPDPETVMTDLQGQVGLVNGTANFSDLSFRIPGAHSRVHGTYNLINDQIDLHGQLRVDTEISNTTSGTKALLLKVMNPFFKKKRKGEVVPVRISGTYGHPTFGLDLDDKKAKTAPRAAMVSK